MDEACDAWRLWHLLQMVSDALWERYESAFMDFCAEERGRGERPASDKEVFVDNDLPF